ncbi:uncharacterized protein BXZ73DRAFT_41473 [Epithele typhae]|uniref:uncharacterized protein n=1 Tax=Epithele typhae TaxID=378194 RepID=UPI0020082D38|nr:uncharacterized protein BXZ73DRAFT_41473 [Epithele typhae]KAH9941836.1 hypothetical protein BXZ73DRAFT_41473 [Epithele typhae]
MAVSGIGGTSGVHTRGNGRVLAMSAVVGIVGTLGYMFVAGKQTKKEEGPASMYSQTQGLSPETNDVRSNSAQVREIVQGQRKP